MTRRLTLLVIATFLVGCRSPSPTFDPFAASGPRRIQEIERHLAEVLPLYQRAEKPKPVVQAGEVRR